MLFQPIKDWCNLSESKATHFRFKLARIRGAFWLCQVQLFFLLMPMGPIMSYHSAPLPNPFLTQTWSITIKEVFQKPLIYPSTLTMLKTCFLPLIAIGSPSHFQLISWGLIHNFIEIISFLIYVQKCIKHL